MSLKVQVTMGKNITKDKLSKPRNHTLNNSQTKILFSSMVIKIPPRCQRQFKVEVLKKKLYHKDRFSFKKLLKNKRKPPNPKVIQTQAQTLILTLTLIENLFNSLI